MAFLAAQKARDLSKTIALAPAPVLPYARLVNAVAEPQNWSSYWGDFSGRHFSDLKQITPANVKWLQARFAAPMLGENVWNPRRWWWTGMYVTGSPGDVAAFDARSGLPIWRFHRKQDVKNPYQINPYNKGVAVLDGRVFFGTLDNNLIALDAHTGRELWEKNINNTMDGYTITGAPLALKDKIIVGMSGGEMGVRGYLDAYDPADGSCSGAFTPHLAPASPAMRPGPARAGSWAGRRLG